ncbi:MAG: caspase family protein, partial [Saprospiraceae bacterium]|nr:caspase family protein [Saprospiraceae bacterium]
MRASAGIPHLTESRAERMDAFARYAAHLPWFNVHALHMLYLNVFEKHDPLGKLEYGPETTMHEFKLQAYKERMITCADLINAPCVQPVIQDIFVIRPEIQDALRNQFDPGIAREIARFMLAYGFEHKRWFIGPRYLEAYRISANTILDPAREGARITRHIVQQLNQIPQMEGKRNRIAYYLNWLESNTTSPEQEQLMELLRYLQGDTNATASQIAEAASDAESVKVKLPREVREAIVAEVQKGAQDAASRTLYLLAIGIDRYADTRIAPLHAAQSDAERFRNYLSENRHEEASLHHVTMYNATATREAVIEQIKSVGQQLQPGDTFVFYFAGYGCTEDLPGGASNIAQQSVPTKMAPLETAPDRVLVLHDTDADTPGLAMDELEYLLTQFPQECTCVSILDCDFERKILVEEVEGLTARSLPWAARPRSATEWVWNDDDAPTLYTQPDYRGMVLHATGLDGNAYEDDDGGCFTRTMLKDLMQNSNDRNYAQLCFHHSDALMRQTQQQPYCEARGDLSVQEGFLGGFLRSDIKPPAA